MKTVLIAISNLLIFSICYANSETNNTPSPGNPEANQVRQNIIGKLPHFKPNGQRILLLMIDGLAVHPFEKALTSGKLPNLSRLFQSRSTAMSQAIATFPSATSPSVPELVSGRYAEIENLPAPGAVHAFDRKEQRVIRYVTNPESWQWPVVTLFDATRNLPAITVFEGRWDGPKSILTQFNMATQAVLEIIGAHDFAEGDRGPIEDYLKVVKSPTPPSVSFVVLNDFDMSAHFYGPDSPQAQNALIEEDKLIGEIIDTLATTRDRSGKSLLSETNIILFGDHGQVRSGKFVDLAAFFKEQHMKAVDVSTIPHVLFRERLGTLWTEWPDAILVSGGSNITQIYFRQLSGGWQKQNTKDKDENKERINLRKLAKAITRIKGVDQVLWQEGNGNTDILADKNRFATILTDLDKNKKRFAYIIPDSVKHDPLDYLDNPEAQSLVCRKNNQSEHCFHSRTEWFDKTFKTRYPGAVALIPKAFHPERFTGDLMVTLKTGYTLILNGPDIRPCHEKHQPKLVDIYPTAVVLLGANTDDPAFADLDGRPLDCIKHVNNQ
jgi:hypothetical protein